MMMSKRIQDVIQLTILIAFLSSVQTLAEEELSPEELQSTESSLPDNILTPEGEQTFDFRTGQPLPENMNDGELEGGDHHIGWNYKNQADWSIEYPECKGIKLRQSPIDIITENVTLRPDFKLEFIDYDQQVEFQLKNTHHSVSATPIPSVEIPRVRPSWLGDGSIEFELQEIHFHWGDGVNKGSEHEINDQKAAAEMHMVHYKKGVTKAEIGNVENSVLVVGVLIESDQLEHMQLDSLVQEATSVSGTDDEKMTQNPENLINLLPENHSAFYTYEGSLTTPPCYEVVEWIVMSQPVFMSHERLVELANVETPGVGSARRKINSNNRDVQPLVDREVFASFNARDVVSPSIRTYSETRFRDSFEEYWRKIKGIKISVRKAFRRVDLARKKLLSKLKKQSDSGSTPTTSEP